MCVCVSTAGMIYAARPVACINQGFEAQLRAYIYGNYDVYVAQQVLLLGASRGCW